MESLTDRDTGRFNVVDLVLHRWKLVLVTAVAFGLISFLYAQFLAEPIYESTVTVSPQGSVSNSGLSTLAKSLTGLGSLPNLRLGESDKVEEDIAYLTSDIFLRRFSKAVHATSVLYRGDRSEVTVNDVVKRLRRRVISVHRDTASGLVRVSVDLSDNELAAMWANQFVTLANKEIRARDMEDAKRSLVYLNRELAKSNITAVQQAISALIETQVNRAMLTEVRPDYAFRVLDPAVASDRDDPAKPNVPAYVLLGLLLGTLVGASVAVLLPRTGSHAVKE